MLNIYYGDMAGAVFNTAVYFKNTYRDAWITDPGSVEMIRDVDSSEVLGNGVIDSPVLGKIGPERLSGGVKALILVDHVPDRVFNVSTCGDNCAKWLLKMGNEKDITVNLHHLMKFGRGPFRIHVLNTDQIAHDGAELVRIAGRFV